MKKILLTLALLTVPAAFSLPVPPEAYVTITGVNLAITSQSSTDITVNGNVQRVVLEY